MMKKEAIILAGGIGSRLKEVTGEKPKCLALVNEKPFINYLIKFLENFEYEKIIISVGYQTETIQSHINSLNSKVEIVYSKEDSPLGTGGALKKALSLCSNEQVLVLNGDSFFEIDLNEFSFYHDYCGADFTLALKDVPESGRYGTIEISPEGNVLRFKEKNSSNESGLINAGIYLVRKNFYLEQCPKQETFSLEKDIVEALYSRFNFRGWMGRGYFIDIGIPEDYKKANDDFKRFANK